MDREKSHTKGDKKDINRGLRLQTAMRDSNCKVIELAHLCGVTNRTVARWRSGFTIMSKNIGVICQRCDTDKSYLIEGINTDPEFILTMDKSETVNNYGNTLAINNIPINRYHIALIRHIRGIPELHAVRMLNRVLNNRWRRGVEPYTTGKPILDGIALDNYEIGAVLALRSIESPDREIDLINQLLDTKQPE